MSGKTKNGVYYDLRESEYFIDIPTYRHKYRFYFSSMLYRNKFGGAIEETVNHYNTKYSSTGGLDVDYSNFALIKLYTTIEKRGCYLVIDGVEINSIHNISLRDEVIIE